jgi:hypothetical protein
MKRELLPKECLFPLFSRGRNSNTLSLDTSNEVSQGTFNPKVSQGTFSIILKDITSQAGIINTSYTLHCFRRGGAQHRFLFARKKWSLRDCKWWGGWSAGEGTNTLMKVSSYI